LSTSAAELRPIRLCGWLGISIPALDLNLQTAYDLELAEDRLARTIEKEIQPVSAPTADSLS
jgi:plasmid maintenance system antidote protein VapI